MGNIFGTGAVAGPDLPVWGGTAEYEWEQRGLTVPDTAQPSVSTALDPLSWGDPALSLTAPIPTEAAPKPNAGFTPGFVESPQPKSSTATPSSGATSGVAKPGDTGYNPPDSDPLGGLDAGTTDWAALGKLIKTLQAGGAGKAPESASKEAASKDQALQEHLKVIAAMTTTQRPARSGQSRLDEALGLMPKTA